jgi:hypothetical protein
MLYRPRIWQGQPWPGAPIEINRSHPLARAVSCVTLFGQNGRVRTLFPNQKRSLGAADLQGAATITKAAKGLGLRCTANGQFWGSPASTNQPNDGSMTYSLPTVGSILIHLTASHAANNSTFRYLFEMGPDGLFGSQNGSFVLLHYNDNTIYFGWTATVANRATYLSTSATDPYGAGDTFTIGGSWSASQTRLYCKGRFLANNTSAPTPWSTAGSYLKVNGEVSFFANLPFTQAANNGAVYSFVVWDRVLTDAEFAEANADIYAFLRPVKRWRGATLPPSGFPVSITETGAAADAFSVTVAGPFAAAITETGAATDAATLTSVRSIAIAEPGAATDAFALTSTRAVAVAETGAATETFTAVIAGAGAAVGVTEAGSATDASTLTSTRAVALAEAGAAADSFAAVIAGQSFVALAESGIAFDAFSVQISGIPVYPGGWMPVEACKAGARAYGTGPYGMGLYSRNRPGDWPALKPCEPGIWQLIPGCGEPTTTRQRL